MTMQKNHEEKKKKQQLIKADDPNAIFTVEGLQQMLVVCKHFMDSRALPQSYTTPQAVLMAIQAGRELGMKPIEAINGMMVINGQVKLWGTALTGRVTRMGYKIKWGTCNDAIASVSIIDPEGYETGMETYSIEDAKKAGLMGKKNWVGHAKVMLRWRALGNAVKFNFPHLLQGYSLVEDDDDSDKIQGEVTEVQQDNASKLLNQQAPEAAVEGEVMQGASPEDKVSVGEGIKLIELIVAAGSNREDVEKYFKKDIYEFGPEDVAKAIKMLNKKIADIEAKKQEPPKEEESIAKKKMREASEKKKAESARDAARAPVNEDVAQAYNELTIHDPAELTQNQKEFLKDCDEGKFHGKEFYPDVKF